MKKILCMLLVIVMIVSLAACGAKKPAETAAPAAPEAPAAEAAAEPAKEGAPAEQIEIVEEPVEEPAEGATAQTEEAADDKPNTEGDIFLGVWECDRAKLTIAKGDDGYKCYLTWGGSASETATWEYDCWYDGFGLSSVETGVHRVLTYNEDGAIANEEVVFTDGAASFVIGDDGNLVWNEYKEERGEGMAFVHTCSSKPAPDPADFIEEYFLFISGIEEGTAGVSLKKARAACSVMNFAAVNELCITDYPSFRDNLLEGFEELSKEEQEAFDANLVDITQLIDDCVVNWEANKGTFEDAGVADLMYVFLSDPIAVLSWDMLKSNTFTMGNGD